MIEVRDLVKSFGPHRVLDGVSLHIERGESVVVIGRSGGGKSILLKHLIGLIRPDSGQVLIGGDVSRVSAEESDAYFAARPRESRLGAWASAQGTPLRDRAQLLSQLEDVAARFPGDDVPRPDFWGGFRLVPRSIEFWQSGEHRLHDRFVYVRQADGGWEITRLSP